MTTLQRIIRKKEVQLATGLSDTTIWRMERLGEFPARIQLGTNSVGWLESDIISWIEGKKKLSEATYHQLNRVEV